MWKYICLFESNSSFYKCRAKQEPYIKNTAERETQWSNYAEALLPKAGPSFQLAFATGRGTISSFALSPPMHQAVSRLLLCLEGRRRLSRSPRCTIAVNKQAMIMIYLCFSSYLNLVYEQILLI